MRPFVRTMSAFGRMGMNDSRNKDGTAGRAAVEQGKIAYLLVNQQVPRNMTLGKSALETPVVSGLA
jgi:hypothetical protein